MITGCFDLFCLGLATGCTGIKHFTRFSAGCGSGYLAVIPVMSCFDHLVTEIGSAVLTFILTDTVRCTGCFFQSIYKLCYVVVGFSVGFILNLGFSTLLASVSRIAAVLAGRCCYNAVIPIMISCGRCKLTLKLLYAGLAAIVTGLLYACRVFTARFYYVAVYPIMSESFGCCFLCMIATGALQSIKSTLVTGCGYVFFISFIKLHVMSEGFATFNNSHVALGCSADLAYLSCHCRGIAGRFLDIGLETVITADLFVTQINFTIVTYTMYNCRFLTRRRHCLTTQGRIRVMGVRAVGMYMHFVRKHRHGNQRNQHCTRQKNC